MWLHSYPFCYTNQGLLDSVQWGLVMFKWLWGIGVLSFVVSALAFVQFAISAPRP